MEVNKELSRASYGRGVDRKNAVLQDSPTRSGKCNEGYKCVALLFEEKINQIYYCQV